MAVQMTGVEGLGLSALASVLKRLMLCRTVRRDSAGVRVSMLEPVEVKVSDGVEAPFVESCARAYASRTFWEAMSLVCCRRELS